MPTVNLPDDPTPEILSAITRGLFAPTSGTSSVKDKLRERVIYRAILRQVAPVATKTVWKVEGSGRVAEPTSHTLTAETAAEIGNAVKALKADGFPDIAITSEQVQV